MMNRRHARLLPIATALSFVFSGQVISQTLSLTETTQSSLKPLPNSHKLITDNQHQSVTKKTITKQQKTLQHPPKSPLGSDQAVKITIPQNDDPKKYYQVQAGETLYSISLKTGQVFQHLAQWNHLPSPYQVHEGQSLKLFNDNENVATEPTPLSTVQAKPMPTKEKIHISQTPIKPIIKKIPAPSANIKTKTAKIIAVEDKTKNKEIKTSIPIGNKKMVKLSFKWPLSGRISKNFAQSNNQGIDIENKVSTQPVLSAAAGQVVYTGSGLNNLKNLIIIKHDPHYLTAYANNNRVLVKEGQQLTSGQIIAEIHSKNDKPASLHFEIRKDGEPVNPLNFLPN